MTNTILLEEFNAVSENGEIYILRVYQEMIECPSFANPNQKVPGLISIKTKSGAKVTMLSEDRFEIPEMGVIVIRKK